MFSSMQTLLRAVPEIVTRLPARYETTKVLFSKEISSNRIAAIAPTIIGGSMFHTLQASHRSVWQPFLARPLSTSRLLYQEPNNDLFSKDLTVRIQAINKSINDCNQEMRNHLKQHFFKVWDQALNQNNSQLTPEQFNQRCLNQLSTLKEEYQEKVLFYTSLVEPYIWFDRNPLSMFDRLSEAFESSIYKSVDQIWIPYIKGDDSYAEKVANLYKHDRISDKISKEIAAKDPTWNFKFQFEMIKKLANLGFKDVQDQLMRAYHQNYLGGCLNLTLLERFEGLKDLALSGHETSQILLRKTITLYDDDSERYENPLLWGTSELPEEYRCCDHLSDVFRKEMYVALIFSENQSFNESITCLLGEYNRIGLDFGLTLNDRLQILEKRAREGSKSDLYFLLCGLRKNVFYDDEQLHIPEEVRLQKILDLKELDITTWNEVMRWDYVNGTGIAKDLSKEERYKWVLEKNDHYGIISLLRSFKDEDGIEGLTTARMRMERVFQFALEGNYFASHDIKAVFTYDRSDFVQKRNEVGFTNIEMFTMLLKLAKETWSDDIGKIIFNTLFPSIFKGDMIEGLELNPLDYSDDLKELAWKYNFFYENTWKEIKHINNLDFLLSYKETLEEIQKIEI